MATGETAANGSDARWERLAPAGALGFLGCVALGALVAGTSPPSSKAPAEEIAAYFAAHRTGQLRNAVLVTFGAFALFPWFLASLFRSTRRAEGDGGLGAVTALVGGVALLGPLLVQAVGWGAAALEAGPHRDPSVAAGMMDLGNMGFLLVPFPAAVLVAATTLAAPPGVLLPGWLARAGWPVTGVILVAGLLGLFPPLPFAALALWLVAVALALMARARRSGPVPT